MKWPVLAALTLALLANNVSAGEVSKKKHCQAGELKCVHHVVKEMSKRFKKLAKSCSHDAIFSLVYLRTTEVYGETAESIGYDDVSSITREDALFADYYFRAYDSYHSGKKHHGKKNHGKKNHGKKGKKEDVAVPLAWKIAFDAAEARSVTASGNALLGINAHIQRDLPFTLYELYLQGNPVSYEDHTLVNEFLAQVDSADEIIQDFDPTYPKGGDSSGIFYWRELAWQNYVALRDAPNEEARAIVASGIEFQAAQAAAYFAATTAYPVGTDSSERDAYCAAN